MVIRVGELRDDVTAAVVGHDDLAKTRGEIGRLDDHPDAGFRAVPARHHAAEIGRADVDLSIRALRLNGRRGGKGRQCRGEIKSCFPHWTAPLVFGPDDTSSMSAAPPPTRTSSHSLAGSASPQGEGRLTACVSRVSASLLRDSAKASRAWGAVSTIGAPGATLLGMRGGG